MDDSAAARDDEKYERFVGLLTANDRALRAFVRTLGPRWHDADEIAQEVALVAWRKFGEFEPGTSFLKWICVIARFKTMSFLRDAARDRLAFRPELLELMAEEALNECDLRSREHEALEQCLAKLPETQRRWITLAYTRGTSSREEATRLGLNEGAFYMRLNRIRRVLLECVRATLREKLA